MFCTPNYEIMEIDKSDIPHLTKIYNSNVNFLMNHMGVKSVGEEWVLSEYLEMYNSGFSSCKIIDIQFGLTIGFIDFKISEETYLSLIMLNADSQGKGITKEVLRYFEDYLRTKNCKRIRLDVVIGYDKSVSRFWINRGFVADKEITLSWNGKELLALKMFKELIIDTEHYKAAPLY